MQLDKPPFNLGPKAIDWVTSTFDQLTADDKLRQLFTLMIGGEDEAVFDPVRAFRPGGITRVRAMGIEAEGAAISKLQQDMSVPLLVSADLEGSRMSQPGGPQWPNPLALAAIDDEAVTETVSRYMAQEARARGINWSFTPVLDVNAAFRSAIVATRGFGSDVDLIERHAIRQMKTFQDEGVASAVKHWPGEGFDDRDQHLVTTINPLDMETWRSIFGRLYAQAIANGCLSVMSAHIALPSFAGEQGETGLELYRPASLSRHLNETLLRQELGFEGLIVSDATGMAGLGSWSDRATHLPEVIASGCDVILFSDNPELDLSYLKAALADGRLSMGRVDEAVLRQLALKAAVGLHEKQSSANAGFDVEQAQSYAQDVALLAPTLVKNVGGHLPLDPQKHKRVLVFSSGVNLPFLPEPLPFSVPDRLNAEGFEVTVWEPECGYDPKSFDLILYLFGDETLLCRGRIFLDWTALTGHFGQAMRRYWHDVPTVMVSFGYPYMLYDAPRVPSYVNAYSTSETAQQAVVELLLGRSDWHGKNPVDPFCGLPDARY